MDLEQMTRQVYSVVRDAERRYVTTDDVSDWLNEAQLDLARRTELLQHTKTGTLSTATLPLPPTPASDPAVLKVVLLRLGADDDVAFTDYDTLNAWKDEGTTPPRTLGFVWDGAVEFYPVPVSGTAYELRYLKAPTELAGPEDVPELPVELHFKLVAYARWQALLKMGDDRAGQYLGLYETGLVRRTMGRDAKWPGPLQLIAEPGPFDTDPEARHL